MSVHAGLMAHVFFQHYRAARGLKRRKSTLLREPVVLTVLPKREVSWGGRISGGVFERVQIFTLTELWTSFGYAWRCFSVFCSFVKPTGSRPCLKSQQAPPLNERARAIVLNVPGQPDRLRGLGTDRRITYWSMPTHTLRSRIRRSTRRRSAAHEFRKLRWQVGVTRLRTARESTTLLRQWGGLH
jgi:hypothetical protein